MDLPKRRANRLNGYDYSQNGLYFLTICTAHRQQLLWCVGANCVRPEDPPQLSNIGKIAEKEIQKLNTIYQTVTVDKFVIMPNHIHMLLMLDAGECGRTQFAPTVSRVVKQYKGAVTKVLGFSIWQKSFYDRIVRNYQEYLKIWEYIDGNPLRWREDILYEQHG